ncbi:flavodoxin [Flavihumibacter sp. ZG627]|uniref:flavodoxin family protein n=1 Tax=Flavihumibacter sp. ZG627 TaxID=1463156 RepID=UPI00057CE385|nr:flavodoxin [Flavihumibacter sp. ZG627]KIC92011.1 flavodoxin [Flavihumibacter sp. ZG627]
MNTKIKYWLSIFAVFCLLSSCSRAQKPGAQKSSRPEDKKVLIVYLSRTKNTKAVAEMIHRHIGGKLVELELKNPYPAHYQTTVDQVARENASGFLPPLKTVIDSIETYNLVFIGFPTWGMQLPPPFKSFLKQYDLSGKTIIPFNTNAGYGVGNGFETIKQLCPNSKILKGFSTEGGKERDGILYIMEGNKAVQVEESVKGWLQEISIIK